MNEEMRRRLMMNGCMQLFHYCCCFSAAYPRDVRFMLVSIDIRT
jgi:hypothetical protein